MQVKFSIFWRVPDDEKTANHFVQSLLSQKEISFEIFYTNNELNTIQQEFLNHHKFIKPLYAKPIEGEWCLLFQEKGYLCNSKSLENIYNKISSINDFSVFETSFCQNKLNLEREPFIQSERVCSIDDNIPIGSIENFIFKTNVFLRDSLFYFFQKNTLLSYLMNVQMWYYLNECLYININQKINHCGLYAYFKELLSDIIQAKEKQLWNLYKSLIMQFHEKMYLWYKYRNRLKEEIKIDDEELYNLLNINELPKISLITPCFNGEKYLSLFLNSLLEQTYSNIQFIFIDDGSTDGTKKIFNTYKKSLENHGMEVIYLFQKNKGQAAAINLGLKVYTGDFLMWPDSDDVLYPENVFRLVSYLLAHPEYGMVTGGYDYVLNTDLNTAIKWCFRKIPPDESDLYFWDIIQSKNITFTPISFMFRTQNFKKALPSQHLYPGRGGQNIQMLLPMVYKDKSGYIHDSLGKHIFHQCSHSKSFKNRFELLEIHYQTFIETLKTIPQLSKTDYKIAIELLRAHKIDEFFWENHQAVNQHIIENEACTGCAACMNICPVSAIQLKENLDGFLYPVRDKTKCIYCGKCLEICPYFSKSLSNSVESEVYMLKASDKIRKNSESGGAFTLFSLYFLRQKGCVCGAAIFNNSLEVKHIIVNNKKDLQKIRRSKYVQSNIDYIYCEVKKILEQKKSVLFSGTPCQIIGLKSFLGKDYENLICIDLICHGVPPQKLWQKFHTENLFNTGKINWRVKGLTWNNNNYYNVSKKYFNQRDPFNELFLRNLILRSSCYSCPVLQNNWQSDITIGDFWGLKSYKPELIDNLGTSLLLCHSQKGKNLIEKIKKNTVLCEKVPLKIEDINQRILIPSSYNERRTECLKLMRDNRFNNVASQILPLKYDAILMNFWFTANMGGVLTTYALQRYLRELGLFVASANWIPEFQELQHKNKISEFAYKNLNLTQSIMSETDLINLNSQTNVFMTGSDQVFNPMIYRRRGNMYLLDFVRSDKTKVAFSASFGDNTSEKGDNFSFLGTPEEENTARFLLKRFNFISVRENKGLDILKKQFPQAINKYTCSILEPVFLVKSKLWHELADMGKKSSKGKYVALFYKKINSLKVPKIESYLDAPLLILPTNPLDVEDPCDFLKLIREAKGIITDSFHVFSFSLIFHKKVIFLSLSDRINRVSDLVQRLKLKSPILTTEKELPLILKNFSVKENFLKMELLIRKERKNAMKFLSNIFDIQKGK